MTPYYADDTVTLYHGDSLDVLRALPDGSVDCCVTSPPYFALRDYGISGQIGLETSPVEYVERVCALFSEVRRVLVHDGALWLNLGDSYVSKAPGNVRGVSDRTGLHGGRTSDAYRDRLAAGHGTKADTTGFGLPEKNLIGIPWRVALALQDDGWVLRSDVIWAKASGMPESVTDRPARRHEHVFLFSKCSRYWFDLDPIREPHADSTAASLDRKRGGYEAPGQREQLDLRTMHPKGANPGDVWTIATQPFADAHFAVMPVTLAERCVVTACKPGGVVLDPFSGSGTTGLAATKHGRRYLGIDLNREYLDLSLRTRLAQGALIEGGAA
jgi:DNA modification methylase